MNQTNISQMVLDIIKATSDGKKLSTCHFKLTELAVNGFLTDEGINELSCLHQMVKDGNYVDWFHGIEHMTKDHSGYVMWKGIVIEHYDFENWDEEDIAIHELHSRCQHIEYLGLKPSIRNCTYYWDEDYKNLEPNTISSAYPWVIEDYYDNDPKWRQIHEYYFDLYLGCVPPIIMHSNSYLCGEAYTHQNDGQAVHLGCRCDDGKYYAQLMTLKEYKAKMYETINQ